MDSIDWDDGIRIVNGHITLNHSTTIFELFELACGWKPLVIDIEIEQVCIYLTVQ